MEFKYYIKKLGAQELGYRNGKQTTGAYFYISKASKLFFPSLSTKVKNDTVILEFKVAYRSEPVFLNLVYHNDRFNRPGGTRDEYRIYLNREIAPDDFFFRPSDIIVIERKNEYEYLLDKYSEENRQYNRLIFLISESKIKGQHALLYNLK